ncbi:MAG: biotin/lipoyl-binding protein [Lachnospiraceae bacterium]|nr:biotin/lipoyl-binding protein [Lachnospiraceae bacterium]
MVRKKIMAGFILFLAFMWLCTLISKSYYTTKLPLVTTSVLEEKYIEHIMKADGIVVEGGKQAVTSLGGLRVESLMVHVGDRVEEGDVLFQIDLDDLKEIIKEKETEIDKLQLQVNTILENQELAKQKKEIEEARAREDYDRTAREKNTDVGRASDVYARTMEELEGADDEIGQQELEDALQQAAYGEADAMRERDSAMRQAQRNIEDILFPEASDSTLSVTRTEIGRLKENLSSYQNILNNQGIVTADASGMITDIYIEAGSRIPDSAAIMMTDDSIPCQFKVLLDKEQKKYVGFGDEVSLKLDGSRQKMDVNIEYFSESQIMPGSFETYITLPEGTGVPGLSGTITRSETGERYNYCISPLAIHKDNIRTFVYILKEREGILGMEYYVEEVNVKVLDENDNWAAVESPSLDGESKIIVSSDKEFAKGDVVRWIE